MFTQTEWIGYLRCKSRDDISLNYSRRRFACFQKYSFRNADDDVEDVGGGGGGCGDGGGHVGVAYLIFVTEISVYILLKLVTLLFWTPQ